jgi:hypothetical protein
VAAATDGSWPGHRYVARLGDNGLASYQLEPVLLRTRRCLLRFDPLDIAPQLSEMLDGRIIGRCQIAS